MKPRQITAFALLLVAMSAAAIAQEPTFMDAATHPGAGQLYSRCLVSCLEYKEAGADAELTAAIIKLAYGIESTLALLLEGEFAHLSQDAHDETGLGRTTLQLKYRVFKHDFGPLDTWRASLLGGATIPGDMTAYGQSHAYPRGSLVSTAILGRHGLNAAVGWEECGDEPDRIAVNGSYLYRLAPSVYTAATRGAWYSMVESLNDWAEAGDYRCRLALGLLYEARRWAWEISGRLPVAQVWQRETHYTIAMGLRWLP